MDALSALSVAAAAVGFFDCAVGLIKEYQVICDRGESATLHAIEKTAKDLVATRTSLLLSSSRTWQSRHVIDENDKVITAKS